MLYIYIYTCIYCVYPIIEAWHAIAGISPSETVLISGENNYMYNCYPVYIKSFHCYMIY